MNEAPEPQEHGLSDVIIDSRPFGLFHSLNQNDVEAAWMPRRPDDMWLVGAQGKPGKLMKAFLLIESTVHFM